MRPHVMGQTKSNYNLTSFKIIKGKKLACCSLHGTSSSEIVPAEKKSH